MWQGQSFRLHTCHCHHGDRDNIALLMLVTIRIVIQLPTEGHLQNKNKNRNENRIWIWIFCFMMIGTVRGLFFMWAAELSYKERMTFISRIPICSLSVANWANMNLRAYDTALFFLFIILKLRMRSRSAVHSASVRSALAFIYFQFVANSFFLIWKVYAYIPIFLQKKLM